MDSLTLIIWSCFIILFIMANLAVHYNVYRRRKALLLDLQNTDYLCVNNVEVARYATISATRSRSYRSFNANIILSNTQIWIFTYVSFLGIRCYNSTLFFDFTNSPESHKPKISRTKIRLLYTEKDLLEQLEHDIHCQLDFYKKGINLQDLLVKYNIPYETGYQGQ